MAEYRYFFADMLTGVLLEELPLAVSSFTQQINSVGTLTGTLALQPLADAGINWRTVVIPNRTWLIVQRDDQYAWGGYVRKTRPTDTKTGVEIGAETLEGWLARRRIKTDVTYTAQDAFTVLRSILDYLAGLTGGDIRLVRGSNSAGQTVTIAYAGKDRTKALDAFSRLAETTPGFEWNVAWTRTGSVFTPSMGFEAPGIGTTLDPIVLEFPGNLIDYSYDEDGGDKPTALTGIGADAAGSPLLYEAVDAAALAAGYPLLEDEISLREESDFARLTDRTTNALAAKSVDYVVPTAVLRGDADPHFGDFPLGVPARLRATSLYHPAGINGTPGLDVIRRVTGWSVVPAPAEKVTLTLGSTTGKILSPLHKRPVPGTPAYAIDLERRIKTIETNT